MKTTGHNNMLKLVKKYQMTRFDDADKQRLEAFINDLIEEAKIEFPKAGYSTDELAVYCGALILVLQEINGSEAIDDDE